MARTVDPARHHARRLQIIDAGLTRFAEDGFDRATTASICREAGIGSGTFFHYFPTKLELLLAILRLGSEEEVEWFAVQEGRQDALGVVLDYATRRAQESSDPRIPGFVRAVGAVMTLPEVAAALADDEGAVRAGLRRWLERARLAGEVRTDLDADRLTHWVMVVIDGYLGRLAEGEGFDAAAEQATLVDVVRRVLE